MKILLVTESHGWSGGAAQTLFLAEGLQRRRHAVWIACQAGGEISRRAESRGLPLIPIRIRGDLDPGAIWTLIRSVSRLGIEILHAQHPKAHGVSLLATFALSHRTPLLVTRRVSFPVHETFFSRLKYRSALIDQFIAVSDGIRQILITGGVDPGKIQVVYSGVDPQTFSRPPAQDALALRRSLNLVDGVPTIIKVANFADWKGQSVFMEAASRLLASGRLAQFLLAGRDTDGAESKAIATRLGLSAETHLLGFRTDVSNLLSISDVSVNSAIAGEGLSGALRESLILGVPIVASDVSGNRELAQEGKTGKLVPPNNAAALADAIAWTLDHKEDARQLAEQGRQRVLHEFTVEHMVQKTESIYQSILRNGKANGRSGGNGSS